MLRLARATLSDPQFYRFAIIGGIGTIINTTILYLLTTMQLYYVFASIIATEVAIICNFFGNHYFTFKAKNERRHTKFITFQLVSIISLTVTVTLLWLLTRTFGEHLLLLWNICAIAAAFLLNFFLNKKFTWSTQ